MFDWDLNFPRQQLLHKSLLLLFQCIELFAQAIYLAVTAGQAIGDLLLLFMCRFSGNWTIAEFTKRLRSVVGARSIVRFLRHRRSINPMSCLGA